MKSNESTENYLEAILILSKEHPVVRSVDIADYLDFKKSSVSVAMKKLRENNDIEVSDEGYITLTESGFATARMIYERHVLISNWLISIGVDEKIAREDACRVEHALSKESFEIIKEHAKQEHRDIYEASKFELNSSKIK